MIRDENMRDKEQRRWGDSTKKPSEQQQNQQGSRQGRGKRGGSHVEEIGRAGHDARDLVAEALMALAQSAHAKMADPTALVRVWPREFSISEAAADESEAAAGTAMPPDRSILIVA